MLDGILVQFYHHCQHQHILGQPPKISVMNRLLIIIYSLVIYTLILQSLPDQIYDVSIDVMTIPCLIAQPKPSPAELCG